MEFEVADAHHPKSHNTAGTTGIRDLVRNPWVNNRKEQVTYHREYLIVTEDERELFEEYLRVYLPGYAKPQLPTEPGVYVPKYGDTPTPERIPYYRIFRLLISGVWTENGQDATEVVKSMSRNGATFYQLGVVEN